jgi:hypothetical protein
MVGGLCLWAVLILLTSRRRTNVNWSGCLTGMRKPTLGEAVVWWFANLVLAALLCALFWERVMGGR